MQVKRDLRKQWEMEGGTGLLSTRSPTVRFALSFPGPAGWLEAEVMLFPLVTWAVS